MYKGDDMPYKECGDCYFWLRGFGCQRIGGCRYAFMDGIPPACLRCSWFNAENGFCDNEGRCCKGVLVYDDDDSCPDEDYPGVSPLSYLVGDDDEVWSAEPDVYTDL